ncbi:MAG: Negative regulator of genetic competence ClpC/MecB [Eubacteriales bacterium SKADARSKE-1]|nr:Negative regulator of genetic competence ClpC/MecB [Eubacteriales bacterium SKADARSKE-1]
MYRFNGFTEKANNALNIAIECAQNFGHTYVGSEHILLGLLKEGTGVAAVVLRSLNLNEEELENIFKNEIGVGTRSSLGTDDFTPRTKRILQLAVMQASSMGHNYVGTEHLLIALIGESDSYAVRFLSELGISVRDILETISDAMGSLDNNGGFLNSNFPSSQNGLIASKSKTKTLDQFGRDLTALASSGAIDPVIGRQKEIERVIQILSRRTKNNPCLIGEPGVGKTAVAEGLALKIVSGDVPETLKGKRLFSLDLTSMIAGTKYRGDFEDRIKNALDEIKKSGNIILFIDELHTIIGAGSAEGSADTANILKPSLARGDFQVIGATTIKEYRKHIEKDAALERRFQPITVGEPTEEEAILILKGLKDRYEAHHKVKITDEAIESAVKLSSRYITDRYLPDKAIDLIDEAASRVRLRAYTAPDKLKSLEGKIKKLESEKSAAINEQDFERAAKLRDDEKKARNKLSEAKKKWQDKNEKTSGEVTTEDIAYIVSNWSGVPVVQLTEEESSRLLKIESILHERIVGQDEAVSLVAKAIRRGRVGLKDPKRPTGSFIFLGPTGVGKTELCKALASVLFGDENAIIRLDMSEYMEKHTVSKLIGSPPGYVGYDEGGQLTEKIRRKPYSVVLFDEIEKAHPDVFNMLLQVLEDGSLTDSQGRRVDFKNSIIIMTSNVGARLITEKQTSLGFHESSNKESDKEKLRETVLAELKKTFKPEFLNRVDDIVVFNKLTNENIRQIAKRLLDEIKIRLKNFQINIEFTEESIDAIADAGFDPIYGARPLRRAIQSKIEDKLSEDMLENKIKAGQTVVCSFNKDDKNFIFIKK